MQENNTKAVVELPDYSAETLEAIRVLSEQFDSQGYHGYSEGAKAAFKGFWGDSAQADLATSIYPTARDLAKGTIRPVYPKGGFNPKYQSLTSTGLSQLIDAVWARQDGMASKWQKFDGYVSSIDPGQDYVAEVVGGAIKPINQSVIAIDVDLDFFGGDRNLPESVAKFFAAATDAYRVRGNRNRMSLIYRQTDCLKAHIDREYPGVNKIICVSTADSSAKVEFSIRDGCSQNIFGVHKTEISYQVLFPVNDCINPLDELGFAAIVMDLLADNRFVQTTTDIAARLNRITAQELAQQSAYRGHLQTVLEGIHALKTKYGVSGAINPLDLLTESTLKIMRGELAYTEASVSVKVDPLTNYPFQDGMRRNTTWQAFSDISFIFQFLRVTEIPHDADLENQFVQKIAKYIKPDASEVVISEYDPVLRRYTSTKTRKWSEKYTISLYNTTYYDSDKCTISKDFAETFMRQPIHLLGAVLQEFLCSKKISDLATQGRKLIGPDVDQSVTLANIATLPDLSDADEVLDDMFEIIFDIQADSMSLINDDAISDAISQTTLKNQQRVQAVSDDWGIFPKYFARHARRYLRRQKGASAPFAVSTMTAMIAQSGYYQVTADPINDAEFDQVAARDGRERYSLNSDGNTLLLMQVLTGDSGAGKSYVTTPLDVALRMVTTALTKVDVHTQDFFRAVTDRSKFKSRDKYTPVEAMGSMISLYQYCAMLDAFREKSPLYATQTTETFSMSDHSADIAALRDAFMITELRLNVRQICNGRLFPGSFYHPICLYFDEAGAFIESTYQNSARITSFCELKAGNPKSFRRANSNLSGAQNDVTFWGATLHGNIPLPKYLATMYKADVKDQKAEGVLGRILLGYIERDDSDVDPEDFKTPYKARTDEEVIATIFTVAMLIPKAVRIMHDELGRDGSCYFSSFRSTTNFYMSRECIDELKGAHDRVYAKIEDMKRLYPENDYAYGTYQGKIYEMLYTLAGGHKLMCDLIAVATQLIPRLHFKVQLGSDIVTYTGWEFSRYTKDRGLQNPDNNGRLIDAIRATIGDLETDDALKRIRSKEIEIKSMIAAETILIHHYDILSYSEVLYDRIIGNIQHSQDAARKATTNALAERNSKTFVAYRIVDCLDKRLRVVNNSTRKITQSDIIRNMLYQCGKGQDDPEASRQLIIQTFNTLIGRLVSDGHLGAAANGKAWFIKTSYAEIQPILGELRINFNALI
jgi:hypothetical protein